MKFDYHRLLICAGSTLLAIGLLVLALNIVQGAGSLTRITIASASNRGSYEPSLSADSRKIAFQSDSDFLGQGIAQFQNEIWLYDTETMTLTRITTASASNRSSYNPSLSADGRKIAFQSDSDFLGQGIQDNQMEIWLYDTSTLTFTRITTRIGNGFRLSRLPQLDAAGTKIVWDSDSDFLGQGIVDDQGEIWLYDTSLLTLTRITSASHPNRHSGRPSISADGTKIAFESNSDFLGQGIPQYQIEIWLYNTETMTLTRITTASASNRTSWLAALSPDGTKIAFTSDSDFLGQGIPQYQNEIWLYDTETMTLTRITTASASNRTSYLPSLNADGSKITFYSDSDFLSQGVPDNQFEVWLYDTETVIPTRVTTASANLRTSGSPILNATGTKIAFSSDSDFLSQGISMGQNEIWLYDNTPILPHLSLTVVDTPDPVATGQYLTYIITITNNGLVDANDVIMSDTLDNNVSFISASGGGTHNTGAITWNMGKLTQGQAITRTFIVTVGNVVNGSLLNNIVSVTSHEGANSFETITTTAVVVELLQPTYLPTVLK